MCRFDVVGRVGRGRFVPVGEGLPPDFVDRVAPGFVDRVDCAADCFFDDRVA